MRAGHVSAAALAATVPAQRGRRRTGRHCPRGEYIGYVRSQDIHTSYRNDKLRYYHEFVHRSPKLSDWYAAPLVERVGRLPGEPHTQSSHPVSFRARPYLLFLAFRGYAVFDYAWMLGAGQLRVVDPAAAMGIDLGTGALIEEAATLGFNRNSARQAMNWTVSRIALHTGVFDATLICEEHIAEALDAVRRFSEREDLRYFYPSRERYRDGASKQWITHLHQLQVVLFHRVYRSEVQVGAHVEVDLTVGVYGRFELDMNTHLELAAAAAAARVPSPRPAPGVSPAQSAGGRAGSV